MSRHVVKYEHSNGEKLNPPIFWCGRETTGMDFYFQDAQHVALGVGGSIQPCKNCIKAIIRELQKEL